MSTALTARGAVDRAEIVAGLREHLQQAADGSLPGDTSAVDAALRDLGDPQLIAAEAAAGSPEPDRASAGRWTSAWVPTAALGLMLLGTALLVFVVPAVLALVGLVLLWGSALWTPGEKAVATVAALLTGTVLWVALSVVTSVETCSTQTSGTDVQTVCTTEGASTSGVVLAVTLGVVAVGGLVTTGAVWRRGTRRAR